MTGILTVPSILFLLLTFVWSTKSETLWSTESDAEEEEEKKESKMFTNETFRSTDPLEDGSTTKLSIVDKLLDSAENVLWSRRLNLTEYDELHDENKHDASPGNNVDPDSLDNVNYFLQDSPVTESSPNQSKTDTSSAKSKTFHTNDPENLTSVTSESDDVTTPSQTTSYECAFGDRKCKSSRVDEIPPLKFGDKITTPVLDSVVTESFWNAVKSTTSSDNETSEELEVHSSVMDIPNYASVTIVPSESTSAQTSENVILIDGNEVGKVDSVIQNLSNKSEKFKPVKHHDSMEPTSEEKTLAKITVTTPINTPTKEIALISEVLHSTTLTSDTRQININSTKDETLVTSETSIRVELIADTMESVLVTKTESFSPPDESHVGKMQEIPSIDYSKMSRQFSVEISRHFSTPSWNDDKSYTPAGVNKHFKGFTENALDVTAVLSPSFRQSSEYLETKSKQPILQSSFSESTTSYVLVTTTSISFTPILETESSSQSTEKDVPTQPTFKEIELPPRLSYPSCSSLPICVEVTLLETTWDQFCRQTDEFREFISKYVSFYTRPILPRHLILEDEICSKSSSIKPLQTSPDVTVAFYVTNDTGEYEERLTEICGIVLRKWAPTSFRSSVLEVRLPNNEIQSTPLPLLPEFNSGFVAAVSISAVAGVALCLLCVLLVIMKHKLIQSRGSDTTTPTADAYSLDSLSINASFRRRRNRRSARSYLNHAFNDQEIPSHPLDIKTLTNCLKSRDLLEEEFKKIPMNMAKLDSIPEGAHVKNRYSNILPKPETRVVLAEHSGDPLKCYINANFVKGYEGKSAFYIACQAPLPEGIEDFWRMVWEQQSRAIVMLTKFEENGTSRCAQYFPQSTLVSQPPFGDFQVSLIKKDVYEFYTMSTLRLLDLEKNLFRDVVHLWFTGWPDVGVPKDPSSLITFVQQCRPYVNSNTGPTIVHCSTGTGRTGVFLALDICMREYEESRSIDILQCISQLRRDRGGAVQNKDQYILIHEAILEYVSRVENQSHCPSVCSKNSREK